MRSKAKTYDNLDEPHLRGQATEAIIKAAFVERGYSLLEPAYDNEPYDFVVESDGHFHRIQAKTARKREVGTLQFETVSTKARSDGYVRDDYDGAIDFFAVFNPEIDDVYLVHIDNAANGKMELRIEPPANNQTIGVNWHEEFQIDRVLETGLSHSKT